jgi:hypothetical protein
MLRPDEPDGAALIRIAFAESSGLMFTDPLVEPGARQTDIVRIVRTAEHVDINLHPHSSLAPFDRLRVRIEYYLRGEFVRTVSTLRSSPGSPRGKERLTLSLSKGEAPRFVPVPEGPESHRLSAPPSFPDANP